MKKNLYWRLIINAENKKIAKKIVDNFLQNIDINAVISKRLSGYEDDNHYDITFSSYIE